MFCVSHVGCGCVLMCKQVPVPNLPAGVHEAGKSVEKADTIFSQERDPRFTEMFAGISACKCPDAAVAWRAWGAGRCGWAIGGRGPRGVGFQCTRAPGTGVPVETRLSLACSLGPPRLLHSGVGKEWRVDAQNSLSRGHRVACLH